MVREPGLSSDGAAAGTTRPIAVVTGASSGIGAAVATALVDAGWDVHGLARRVPEQRRDHITHHPVDLADAAAVAAWTDEFTARTTRLNALVHVAGVIARGPVEDIARTELDGLLAVNLTGPWQLTAALLPALRAAAGQVVVVNSSAAVRPGADASAYAASKAAMRAFADGLRAEEGRNDVRVCSIFPGRVATPMQEQVLAHEGRRYEGGSPQEGLLQPSDIADSVAHVLALPRRAEITDIHIRPARPLPS